MKRILIADDHAIIRAGLKKLLADEFPSVVIEEATNGEELIRKTKSGSWDVVICDISMPGRNGLEIIKEIKEEYPQLPVVVLTMHPEEQYALRALRVGASAYITKDSAPQELIQALRMVAMGKRYITASLAERMADLLVNDSPRPQHELLSDREFVVFKMIASGMAVSEIAGQLSLSVNTISTYRARILDKMKLRHNADLMQYAIQHKLV
jgi:two-component system, NarL family, invasion response regulator UvrY